MGGIGTWLKAFLAGLVLLGTAANADTIVLANGHKLYGELYKKAGKPGASLAAYCREILAKTVATG